MKNRKTVSLLLILSAVLCFSGCAGDLGEKFANAGMNTLMGMGIVFLVLILISVIISAFSVINRAETKSKEKKAGPAESPEPVPVLPEPEPEEDDTELIAVIAAAIAAYEGSSPDGIVVRSIRRVSSANKWKRG